MATTNIPSQTRVDAESQRRSDEERRAVADANRGNVAASSAPADDVGELDKQARDAVEHRATAAFDASMAGGRARLNEELKTADQATRERREAEFNAQNKQLREDAVKRAMAVYEDAIKRRGHRQAATDQMQAAVGLPTDPARRQAEIEKRGREGDAAMSAQSGVGTVQDHLDGSMSRTRLDEERGDNSRAEFNPHVQEGHGQNIASMAQASARLQAIAPGAPMTPENVNDPHGANDRMEKDKALQRDAQPKTNAPQQNSNVTALTPGGKTNDPLLSNANQPNQGQANQGKPQVGLSAEQIAQRDRVAGSRDPS